MVHNKITIYGHVQGVFFRASTLKTANALGIKGWVENLSDGTVRIEAEGSREQQARLLSWCNHGPENARVEKVDCEPGEVQGFSTFEIR